MKRSFLMMLPVLLATSVLFGAPWLGGYRLSFDGYRDRPGQYYGLHLHLEPLWGSVGLDVGGATSFGLSEPSSYFEASVEIGALNVRHMLFRRPSTWRIALGGGVVTDFGTCHGYVRLDPFVFFFGEKTVKVLGLRLLDDRSWALRLLEITHYFF
ncbi:MAG: hypothetical protein GX911_03920 [Spirochaetales bacterium]|nr:hypothetical protein [Spirochaetales bacterium]